MFITSGLLKAIPDKIAEIANLRCTDLKALVNDFGRHGQSARDLLIPQVPILHQRLVGSSERRTSAHGRRIGLPPSCCAPPLCLEQPVHALSQSPDDMGNLYDYPAGALNEIRRNMSKDLDAYIEGPAKVALFLYDNRTLVVENFNDEPVNINIVMDEKTGKLTSLENNGEVLQPQPTKPNPFLRNKQPSKHSFRVTLMPHSYKAYKY